MRRRLLVLLLGLGGCFVQHTTTPPPVEPHDDMYALLECTGACHSPQCDSDKRRGRRTSSACIEEELCFQRCLE